jgi:predicted transcriptional regulator
VDDSSPGLVSMTDIARAIADGKTDLKVNEIMTRGFLTIDAEEPIYEAIKILGRNGSSQLVVSESGSLWGIITAADLVKSLTPT